MPTMDPFVGAKSEGEDQKRGLLDAIAEGGVAGKQAYQDAQKEVGTYRQGALDRASQRANMTGQSFGGAEMAPVTEAADRYGTYFAGQRAASQSQLDQIGASGTSYLAKINAIAPFVQNQNLQAAADREQGFKTEIAANQSKIDGQKLADQANRDHDIKMLQMRLAADQQQAGASARATASKESSASVKGITLNQLVGAAQQQPNVYKDSGNIMASVKGQNVAAAGNLVGRAGTIGRNLGVDEAKLAGLTEPGFMTGLAGDLAKMGGGAAPTQPPLFDKNWLTNSFRYDGKPISGARADEVMRAPETKSAERFISDLSNAKLGSNGRLVPGPIFDESFSGLTLREAFNNWIDQQPGIRTMKTALKDYYGPYLDSYNR